ncbi:MAG: rhombosortase [Opitutaceae bacterium]|nr:rhombosortase [Opitutaceae bacterium]
MKRWAEWRARLPWVFLTLAALALVAQCMPAWRGGLIYDRAAIARGEWWRLWTGHWVHFGWPHFLADTGLFLIMGWTLRRAHRRFALTALVAMPLFVSLTLWFLDPEMERYAGLSALNLGLLLYLALQGWQRDWRDWFWPAVLMIYAGEVVFEIMSGGTGGGMIKFDDATVRVATGAHIAAGVYALGGWLLERWRQA